MTPPPPPSPLLPPTPLSLSRAAAAVPNPPLARLGRRARCPGGPLRGRLRRRVLPRHRPGTSLLLRGAALAGDPDGDRKSTRLNSSHLVISYAVFCLKKKKNT